MYDILIIGAGVTGAFVARSLAKYETSILVLEKENDVCNGTSMANSAIVHSGYDPIPNTKKAYFNVLGCNMMPVICEELDVNYRQCGTLTVSCDEGNHDKILSLLKRAEENGVPAKLINKETLLKMEPNLSNNVFEGIFCPTGGIVNPFELTIHALENAIDNGVKLKLGEEVLSIEQNNNIFEVRTNKSVYKTRVIINCAGLNSDTIAKLFDENITWDIRPRKGEYFVLDHFNNNFINHVIFPLPSEKGKGILLTPTTANNYLIGPSSEWQYDKDDTSTDFATLSNVKKSASLLVPSIPFNQQIRTFSGLRATPSTHDFIIEPSPKNNHFINIAGIESPGLASSPAIGKYVAKELVKPLLHLYRKQEYCPRVRPYIKPLDLTIEERNKLIKIEPNYGKIVCKCEKISLGEIEDVLSRSVPCLTIKAVKKRTRSGFGKCQGGFCQPQIINLLSKKQNCSPLNIKYDRDNSEILNSEVKIGEIDNETR